MIMQETNDTPDAVADIESVLALVEEAAGAVVMATPDDCEVLAGASATGSSRKSKVRCSRGLCGASPVRRSLRSMASLPTATLLRRWTASATL